MEGLVFFWLLIGTLVGAAIGQRKSRPMAGALFGALLGPVGWLLTAVGPDMGPKCPECLGSVVANAHRCQHCGGLLRGQTTAATGGPPQ